VGEWKWEKVKLRSISREALCVIHYSICRCPTGMSLSLYGHDPQYPKSPGYEDPTWMIPQKECWDER